MEEFGGLEQLVRLKKFLKIKSALSPYTWKVLPVSHDIVFQKLQRTSTFSCSREYQIRGLFVKKIYLNSQGYNFFVHVLKASIE